MRMIPDGAGWTGGQYSLFRLVFGLYLAVHYAALLPYGPELFAQGGMLPDAALSPLARAFPNVLALWDGPAFVTALLAGASALALLLAVGWHDRVAACLLWYVGACLIGRNPLVSNPALPYVGWLLLAHAVVPRAPFGAWRARGRVDPGGGWALPRGLFAAAWVVLAVGYSYSGVTKMASPSWLDGSALVHVLENPLARPTALREALLALPPQALALATWGVLALEVGFAPLALVPRLRPFLWSGMLLVHLGIVATVDFADLSLGMVMAHLFTFDPAWVPGRAASRRETLYYDGACGLCHGFVRFVLAERPQAFTFAPLGGERFRARWPGAPCEERPGSLRVDTGERVLTRSEAVLHVLARLGGAWRVLAAAGALVPVRLRDALYDAVARARRRRAPEACPLAPPHLAGRFAR